MEKLVIQLNIQLLIYCLFVLFCNADFFFSLMQFSGLVASLLRTPFMARSQYSPQEYQQYQGDQHRAQDSPMAASSIAGTAPCIRGGLSRAEGPLQGSERGLLYRYVFNMV